MIYRLRKKFRFEASHQLKNHDGKCANLHGHSWTGYIEVSGHDLYDNGPKENMLLDYGDIGYITKAIETEFDHKHLNDVLKSEMPTSELVAKVIWDKASVALAGERVRLTRVVINETCNTRCILDDRR